MVYYCFYLFMPLIFSHVLIFEEELIKGWSLKLIYFFCLVFDTSKGIKTSEKHWRPPLVNSQLPQGTSSSCLRRILVKVERLRSRFQGNAGSDSKTFRRRHSAFHLCHHLHHILCIISSFHHHSIHTFLYNLKGRRKESIILPATLGKERKDPSSCNR